MDKAEKQRAIEAGKMAREAMDRDTVLSVGMKIRRRSTALFLSNVLCIFPVILIRSPWIDFPILAFMVGTYGYSRTFYIWEKKNASYLRRLGFDVKT
jgi:hypothetical protein